MGHGNLSRLGIAATAGEARVGNGVVRRSEGTPGHERLLCRQHSHNGINLTDLQGFLPGHVRKNGGQAFRKHTLSGAGRADEQHIMAPCRRNLQGTFHILLAQYVFKIQLGGSRSFRHPQGLLV